MLDKIPSEKELQDLLGQSAYSAWQTLVSFILQNYSMDTFWDSGRKAGIYEYKFRKSNKTLCALYAKEQSFGFMIIYGKAERETFEQDKERFSPQIQTIYDETRTYHDGKWIMIDILDDSLIDELKNMIFIKKKPKKS